MKENKSERKNLKKNAKKLTIVKIAYIFSSRIMKLVQTLPKKTGSLELGKELMRSSTSIADYLEEAQEAFSKEDFILKLNNALKEARKTNLCLKLICHSKLIDSAKELEGLFQESEGIEKVLYTIAESSRKR